MSLRTRKIQLKTRGMPASDGAGVRLTRMIGSPELNFLDPFLMLDHFQSDNPDDYIAGFPPHPHRGFETVTYMLAGKMRHKDNHGHEGVIEPGGVQWMTAGKGIIHSEMPEQENGLMSGFQLWVNLPSHAKMTEPGYQEYKPQQLVTESRASGEVRVITGKTQYGSQGPVINNFINPQMFDVQLESNQSFIEPIQSDASAFIYVIEGRLFIEDSPALQANELAVLADGEQIDIRTDADGARFLYVSALPINEPIARGGPFVMNTPEEVEQAFSDYRHGAF
ncbi:pirin family protein [Thiomicrorhabdus sediminis]|uniref:Pirin family protein n=1 Tax=Thiomicrorhabdus sediminis TaxID=2580412 RepID=A0A4P9K5J4_9GAMM|nr:pirin family protein [Thiomicrorhabdus sediminis]QCU90071.1 pirin family protein [Thiomicrorhabdus sediminis]